MNIMQLKDILEILSSIAIILGIPFGLLEYIRTKRREQRDREYETYNALDEKYLQYLALCLEHTDLDIFDVADSNPSELNEKQKKEELIAFTILFSIFERAYIMYYDQSTKIKEKQWKGWEGYIREYCGRKNFIQAWKISGQYFDADFQKFMEKTIHKEINKNK
ncbi:MAG: hypothetical protein ABIK76_01680 [candidate division WOR-3 bacterium]